MEEAFFLGFDSSTQSLSASVIDAATLRLVHRESLNFDADLPHHGTKNGMHRSGEDEAQVTSPVTMWIEALDTVLSRLSHAVPLSKVVAVSGSGQQHGTVYCGESFEEALRLLDPSVPMAEQ